LHNRSVKVRTLGVLEALIHYPCGGADEAVHLDLSGFDGYKACCKVSLLGRTPNKTE